jgi:hypothetical protein
VQIDQKELQHGTRRTSLTGVLEMYLENLEEKAHALSTKLGEATQNAEKLQSGRRSASMFSKLSQPENYGFWETSIDTKKRIGLAWVVANGVRSMFGIEGAGTNKLEKSMLVIVVHTLWYQL